MSLGSIVGIGLSSYLPGADPAVRAMAGGVIGGVIERGVDRLSQSSTGWLRGWWQKNYSIIISRNDDNLIYNKLERYVVQRHIEKVRTCTLKPKDGEIIIGLGGADIRGTIIEKWGDHEVLFEINTKEAGQKDNSTVNNQIIIRSNTAKVEDLQRYVESICQYRESSRSLRIYRAVVEIQGKGEKEHAHAYWSLVNTLTNKRIDNTILSESAEKNLYNDVNWFLSNQSTYDSQGIPYKRGYFLYGVPGTGKTSTIKAIANEYRLDVFSVQMNDLTNNSQFTLLMTRITELTGNKPYILALEDFDRCSLFDRWGESKLSLGSILNELDGVTETFGRILFITANSRERFTNRDGIDALFRPGRIDKEVQLDYCDAVQIKRMVKQFVNVDLQVPQDAIPKKITPAKVISVLQQYVGQDKGLDLLKDIQNWEFWSELQKNDSTTSASSISGNPVLKNLERRIKTKRRVITRQNRDIKRLEHGSQLIDKKKEQYEKAQAQLKKMRSQLAAKKRKIRRDAKKATKRDASTPTEDLVPAKRQCTRN